MMRYILAQKKAHGVESICATLPITPSTYCEYKSRDSDASQLPPRQQRDAVLKAEAARVWNENHEMYGVRLRCGFNSNVKASRYLAERCAR